MWTTALGGRDARVPPRDVHVLEFGTHIERGRSPLEFGDELNGDALEFGADDDAALEFGADLDGMRNLVVVHVLER